MSESIESLLRKDWVIEIWYSPEAPNDRRYVAVVSKGLSHDTSRGDGPTVQKAIASAIEAHEERGGETVRAKTSP